MTRKFDKIVENCGEETLEIGGEIFLNETVSDKGIQCSLLGAVIFSKIDFEDIDFTGSNFINCEFRNCNFKMSYFENANFGIQPLKIVELKDAI